MTKEERDVLVADNMRLVPYLLRRYICAPTWQWDDYLSAGYYGLAKAADVYDPDRGVAFNTFAGKCILNQMYIFARSEKKHEGVASYDAMIRGLDDDIPVSETLPAQDNPAEDAERMDTYRELYAALRSIAPLNAVILRDVYGLGGRKVFTQEEVAHRQGISQSYVARICKREQRRLRTILEGRGIHHGCKCARE